MLQIKIVEPPREWENGKAVSLEDAVNKFLATIEAESVKDIRISDKADKAVIQYEVKEAWKDQMCGDCKYWDDGGSPSAVRGLCHECGGRRRFNCRACKEWKDMRG